jgi:hypothetical protein
MISLTTILRSKEVTTLLLVINIIAACIGLSVWLSNGAVFGLAVLVWSVVMALLEILILTANGETK